MEKRSLVEMLFYRYELVGEVEKDGKAYSKYKRKLRLGGLFYILTQSFKIILVGVLAVLLSHVLINTVFSEKNPSTRQFQK